MNANPSKEAERILAAMLIMMLGPSVIATVLPRLRTQITQWTLESNVLVPTSHALFAVPGLDAGPDLRRVAIAVLALVFALWLVTRARAAKRADGDDDTKGKS